MKIEFDKQRNKFLISCAPHENQTVMGLTDKRFRKTSKVWAAPCLRRNVEYMQRHMNNKAMFSEEAWQAYSDKVKSLSDESQPVENSFPSWYEFKNQPFAHQDRGLKKWFPLDVAGIFYEQGLGKTFTSINLIAAWRMTNKINAAVVVCPSSIKLVWEREVPEHCPIPAQLHVLKSGGDKAFERFLNEPNDFPMLVVGVEGLSQGRAHEKLEKFLRSHNCAFIIDESSKIKTPNKTRTDRCIELGGYASKRIVLSGTSITQGIEDLYTQINFLDKDILGFHSFYSFRNHFCVTIPMQVGTDPRTGREITVDKIVGYKNQEELVELLSPYVERVEKKDALDLPDKVFSDRMVTMNPTQRKLYKQMEEELAIDLDGEEYEVSTILEKALRLQQITGGHYPWDDGEKVVPKAIKGKNPKIEELMSLMDEVSGKVIVWCQFRPEIELVAETLAKNDIGFVEFHGGCSDDEKSEAVAKFKDDEKTKVFLATRAASYGLTLTVASTSIYYSQGYSLEDYSQSQDRIHRIGQKHSCSYIHLLAQGTVDEKIIEALAAKQATASMMYENLKNIDK